MRKVQIKSMNSVPDRNSSFQFDPVLNHCKVFFFASTSTGLLFKLERRSFFSSFFLLRAFPSTRYLISFNSSAFFARTINFESRFCMVSWRLSHCVCNGTYLILKLHKLFAFFLLLFFFLFFF